MRTTVLGVLGLGILAASGAARADVTVHVQIGPPPVVFATPPPVVVVPGVPTVHYVPSAPVDLFVVGGRWYAWHGGVWWVARSYRGPWARVGVAALPAGLLSVPPTYSRVPPGHLKAGELQGPGQGRGRGRH